MNYSIGNEMRIVVAAIFVSIALFITLLFVGYYLDDIKSPAADESSYPAPRSH